MPLQLSSQINWGMNNENVLTLGYPLDNVTCYAMERAGSEVAQAASGTEDGWYTGTDYILEADVRWIPEVTTTNPAAAGYSQPTGLDAMLAWGRAKNTLRFIPDRNFPQFYQDCYLAEDLAGSSSANAPTLEKDGTYKYHLTLRSPNKHFGQMLRGILFEYAPGASLVDPVILSETRGSVADFINVNLGVSQAAVNALRDRNYTAAGIRNTLLEPTHTNSLLQSQALATTWTANNATPTNAATTAPDATVTGCTLVPNTTNTAGHYVTQNFTITSGEFLAGSVFVKAGAYNGFVFRLSDSGSANGIQIGVNLTTGAVVLGPQAFGAGVVGGGAVITLANGWFRVLLWGSINAAVTTGSAFCYVYDTAAHAGTQTAYAGDGTSGIQVWGVQAERNGVTANLPPTSYIPTTTVTVTRAGDAFIVPILQNTQPTWVLVDFIELGAIKMASGTARVFEISSFGVNPRLFLYQNSGKYTFALVDVNAVQYSSQAAAAPNFGDRVQLLGYWDGTAFISLVQSINGGAPATVTAAAAVTGSLLWGLATAGIFGDGGGGSGSPGGLISLKVGVYGFGGTNITTLPQAIAQ